MALFHVKCPVEPKQREWLDLAMQWLIAAFPSHPLNETEVILPTPEYFPDRYSTELEDVQKLVERVCGYMKVDPTRLKLELYEEVYNGFSSHLPTFEGSHRGAVGTYIEDKGALVIGIESSQLTDPMGLVAIIAHELGHVCLLGDGRMKPERRDHEYFTDLFTVFSGLGIFNANAAFTMRGWKTRFGHGWSAQRRGYMNEQMFGYALGLFAWLRGEENPSWYKFLEGSPRTYFKTSMKFLSRYGDDNWRSQAIQMAAAEP